MIILPNLPILNPVILHRCVLFCCTIQLAHRLQGLGSVKDHYQPPNSNGLVTFQNYPSLLHPTSVLPVTRFCFLTPVVCSSLPAAQITVPRWLLWSGSRMFPEGQCVEGLATSLCAAGRWGPVKGIYIIWRHAFEGNRGTPALSCLSAPWMP